MIASGGDYTKLSSALAAITDAAADKRYLVEVYGQITDDAAIAAKDYIDVDGYNAEVLVVSTSTINGLNVNGVTNSKWRHIIIRRQGVVGGAVHAIRAYGVTDKTFILDHCFGDNQTTGVGYCTGIRIDGAAEPTLLYTDSEGGDGGVACIGLSVLSSSGNPQVWGGWHKGGQHADGSNYGGGWSNFARGTYIGARFTGGAGPNSAGVADSDASAPVRIECLYENGAGSFSKPIDIKNSACSIISGGAIVFDPAANDTFMMEIADAASPKITGLHADSRRYVNQWWYDDANDGRFRPFADHPYQVIGISIYVNTLLAGGTLDIGTSVGGHEVVEDYDISTTGYKSKAFAMVEVAANGYLYATPSAAIDDSAVEVFYTVIRNYSGCYGCRMDTVGFAELNGVTLISNGASDCLYLTANSVATKNWKITNSHLETLDPVNQNAINAASAITDAPIHAQIKGKKTNITSIARTGLLATKNIMLTAAGGWPSTTNGAAQSQVEYGTNDVDLYHLAFDTTTQEHVQWAVPMPDAWDGGTLTARFIWTNAAGLTTETVQWGIQGRSYGNDDAIDQAWGTAQVVSDTWIAQNDVHTTAETPAITLAGTPGAGELAQFRVYRDVANDDMTGDARLIAVILTYTEM